MRLRHCSRSANDRIVGIQFHRNDESGIAAAIFGIHASVCTKCVIGTAAKLDRCIGLPVGDRDLVAADVSQPAGATGPTERIRRVNAVFQRGTGVDCSSAAAGVILPFGLFIFFIIVFEFGLLAGSSTAFLLLGGFFFLGLLSCTGSAILDLDSIAAVEFDPLVRAPRLGSGVSVLRILFGMRRDR